MTQPTRLLQDLVALPSVNPMGRDLPAALALEHRVTGYLENFFRELGVPYERQPVAPTPHVMHSRRPGSSASSCRCARISGWPARPRAHVACGANEYEYSAGGMSHSHPG